MSNERLYNELEEICNYDLDEMKRTLDYLQDRLEQAINNEEEE